MQSVPSSQISPTHKKAASQELTVVITAASDPECVLVAIESFIALLGPDVAIIVSGDLSALAEYKFPRQVRCVTNAKGDGGRNLAVSLVKTPHVLICGEECLPESDFQEIAECLKLLKLGWDVVGSEAYFFERNEGVLTARHQPITEQLLGCDITLPFFLAKTDVLVRVPWDDAMNGITEHADHFLRMKSVQARVAGTKLLRFRRLNVVSHIPSAQGTSVALFEERYGCNNVKWENASTDVSRKWFSSNEVRKVCFSIAEPGITGWLNIGSPTGHEWNMTCSLKERLFLAENTFNFVYAYRALERMNYYRGLFLLLEAFRILRHGGVIRVCTFDLGFLFRLYSGQLRSKGDAYVQWAIDNLVPHARGYDPAFVVNHQMFSREHQFLHDETTLADALETVGFTNVKRRPSRCSDWSELNGLEARTNFPAEMEEMETLIMEGTRP